MIKYKYESDGACFGKSIKGCLILSKNQRGCGTYLCPFYKPTDCKDWIRLDKPNMIVMLPPEAVEIGSKKKWLLTAEEKAHVSKCR